MTITHHGLGLLIENCTNLIRAAAAVLMPHPTSPRTEGAWDNVTTEMADVNAAMLFVARAGAPAGRIDEGRLAKRSAALLKEYISLHDIEAPKAVEAKDNLKVDSTGHLAGFALRPDWKVAELEAIISLRNQTIDSISRQKSDLLSALAKADADSELLKRKNEELMRRVAAEDEGTATARDILGLGPNASHEAILARIRDVVLQNSAVRAELLVHQSHGHATATEMERLKAANKALSDLATRRDPAGEGKYTEAEVLAVVDRLRDDARRLARYSFHLSHDPSPLIRRTWDKLGNWIDIDDMRTLLDTSGARIQGYLSKKAAHEPVGFVSSVTTELDGSLEVKIVGTDDVPLRSSGFPKFVPMGSEEAKKIALRAWGVRYPHATLNISLDQSNGWVLEAIQAAYAQGVER